MPIDHNCSEWVGKYNCFIWERQIERSKRRKSIKTFNSIWPMWYYFNSDDFESFINWDATNATRKRGHTRQGNNNSSKPLSQVLYIYYSNNHNKSTLYSTYYVLATILSTLPVLTEPQNNLIWCEQRSNFT